VDTFAGAAETGPEIGRIVGEAGTRGSRGDLRSPARLPDGPRSNARHLESGPRTVARVGGNENLCPLTAVESIPAAHPIAHDDDNSAAGSRMNPCRTTTKTRQKIARPLRQVLLKTCDLCPITSVVAEQRRSSSREKRGFPSLTICPRWGLRTWMG
jgi:hypothetical protein